MFTLLVSNTLSNSATAFLFFGPGIEDLTVGPDGSLEKKGCCEAADRTALDAKDLAPGA
jgi:hypothetical protein